MDKSVRRILWAMPLIGLLMFAAHEHGKRAGRQESPVITIQVVHAQEQLGHQSVWENAVYRPEETDHRGLWKR